MQMTSAPPALEITADLAVFQIERCHFVFDRNIYEVLKVMMEEVAKAKLVRTGLTSGQKKLAILALQPITSEPQEPTQGEHVESTQTCVLCIDEFPPSKMFSAHCNCRSGNATKHVCAKCAADLIRQTVEKSQKTQVDCPICHSEWPLRDIRRAIPSSLFIKLFDRRLSAEISRIPGVHWCPQKDCPSATLLVRRGSRSAPSVSPPLPGPSVSTGATTAADTPNAATPPSDEQADPSVPPQNPLPESNPISDDPASPASPPAAESAEVEETVFADGSAAAQCVVCVTCCHEFCSGCRQPWHGGRCQSLQPRDHSNDERQSLEWLHRNTKPCPKCRSPLVAEGTSRATCSNCHHAFCYKCGAKWRSGHSGRFNLPGCPGRNRISMWTQYYPIEYYFKIIIRILFIGIGYVVAGCLAIPAAPFFGLVMCFLEIRKRRRRRRQFVRTAPNPGL